MKRKISKIIISTLCILLLFIIKVYPEQHRVKNAGYITSVSKCKRVSGGATEECIVLDYENEILHIKHINAEFNCCFKDIKANIEIISKKIIIQSYEDYVDYRSDWPCAWTCLYDIGYDIPNLKPGKYVLVIDNSKADRDHKTPKMEIAIDLSENTKYKQCF